MPCAITQGSQLSLNVVVKKSAIIEMFSFLRALFVLWSEEMNIINDIGGNV
jgi:hypothetical protein